MRLYEAMEKMQSSRSLSVDVDTVTKAISKDCKDALHHYQNGIMFFRGNANSYDHPYQYIEPSKHVRVSANTSNLYTTIIDNSAKWKSYPKRSKSIICSTSRVDAEVYGDPCIVFPKDGYKIGICPEADLWVSFQNSGINGLDIFNDRFEDLVDKFLHKRVTSADLKDIGALKKLCYELDAELEEQGLMGIIRTFKYAKYYNGSMLDVLDDLLDPVFNGFKLITSLSGISSLRYGEHEMWTDSDCYLVNYDVAKKTNFMK